MKIYLTAIILCQPEFREAIKKVLKNMVVQARKEKACLQYDLHQGSEDENIFVFHEIWENREGLNKHNDQTYIREFVTFTKNKLQQEATIYLTQKL